MVNLGREIVSTAPIRRLFVWMRRDPDNFLSAIAAPFLLLLIVWVHIPDGRPAARPEKAPSIDSKPDHPDDRNAGGMEIAQDPDPGTEGTEVPPAIEARVADWSEATNALEENPDYAQSQAICLAVRSRSVPAADRPRPRLARSLAGCRPLDLYYNEPDRRDPVRARMCALSEAFSDQPDESRLVLMNIYANAEGVRRDLDLSIHYACGLNVQPSEMHDRVRRLDRLRAEDWTGGDFDYVLDDRTSFTGGTGVYYYIRVDAERRTAELSRLTAAWPPAQRRALARLERAKEAYAEAHAHAAFYHSSPAGWIEYGSIENVEEAFLAQIRTLRSGQVPSYSPVQAEATRRRIESNFRRSQLPAESLRDRGPPDFARAERAWRAYRDAFIVLAQLRSPGLSRERLATWLGRTRPDREYLDSSNGLTSRSLPFDMDPTDARVSVEFASPP